MLGDSEIVSILDSSVALAMFRGCVSPCSNILWCRIEDWKEVLSTCFQYQGDVSS